VGEGIRQRAALGGGSVQVLPRNKQPWRGGGGEGGASDNRLGHDLLKLRHGCWLVVAKALRRVRWYGSFVPLPSRASWRSEAARSELLALAVISQEKASDSLGSEFDLFNATKR
jgi:hypothetical protein